MAAQDSNETASGKAGAIHSAAAGACRSEPRSSGRGRAASSCSRRRSRGRGRGKCAPTAAPVPHPSAPAGGPMSGGRRDRPALPRCSARPRRVAPEGPSPQRAAAARLIPSSAFAIASIRRAARFFFSRAASALSSAALRSSLISSARPIPAACSLFQKGIPDHSDLKALSETGVARAGIRCG